MTRMLALMMMTLLVVACGRDGVSTVPSLGGTTWTDSTDGSTWEFAGDGRLCVASSCTLHWHQDGASLTLATPETLDCTIALTEPRLTITCPGHPTSTLDRSTP